MKTERRHELQTNELADWIGVHVESIKPYTKAIIGVTVLGIAALLTFAMMRGQRQGQTEASWTEYFAAAEMQDLGGLRELASRYQGLEPAAWAMQSVGDIEAATGARDLYIDRNDARERLLLAKEAYTEAINGSKESMLLQRAHMGLAQVYESLGEFDNAKSEYELIANTWKDSAIAREALDRMRFLDDPSTIEFAAWFAKQEPPKQDALNEVLQGGAGIKPPSPSDDLPDIPELSLPSADELDRPAEMEMTPPEQGVENPPSTDDAGSKPADEPSASESAPAEEAPVSEDEESTAAADSEDTESTSETPPKD